MQDDWISECVIDEIDDQFMIYHYPVSFFNLNPNKLYLGIDAQWHKENTYDLFATRKEAIELMIKAGNPNKCH